jgi:adenine-specific DNA methylase
MIPRECKRLAEVDFPIAEVSKHSAREKSIRHGHPSTLHLWWARRPLAACRAMLMALLLPDPCDPACPNGFKDQVRTVLARTWKPAGSGDEELQRSLLSFIADFSNWDRAKDPVYLDVAHSLVKAAHDGETPTVVDPFSGVGQSHSNHCE